MNTNSKDNILFFFTSQFPYGTGETFIENELMILSSTFANIYLFPSTSEGEARRLPSNVEVVNWQKKYHYSGIKTLIKHLLLFFKIFSYEFYHSPNKLKISRSFSELRSMLLQNIAKAESINEEIKKHKSSNNTFYTFWLEDWAIVLGILKQKKVIREYYSRVHGYDLYDERRENGFIPFRNFQMKTVKNIFAVSKDGVNYLTKQFPQYGTKIKLNHLGVFDNGINPLKKEQIFTLVSCSNLIPLKKVNLIIEILKNVTIPIQWIHFGDGALKNELFEQAKQLPNNVIVVFKGQLPNSEILNFYKSQSTNLMIHLSETEGGVPIAIQEAASFGIPIIATNVGGIPEIVTASTGILIPIDFEIKKTAQLINDFQSSFRNTEEFRLKCREFWKQNFDAKKNYEKFIVELTNVNTNP